MHTWRLTVLRSFIVFLFIGIVGRLFFWQLLSTDKFQAQAESQRSVSQKIPGTRGAILFSDGQILADSQLSYLVFADRSLIPNPNQVASQLTPILEVPEASLSAKLATNSQWIPLVRQVSAEKKRAIETQNIVGLGFERSEKRFYPEASMAANLLGFVGKDTTGRDKGYFGLEGFYDTTLAGKEGFSQEEKDILGRPILTAKSVNNPPEKGHTLQLTIDRTVQYIVEQKLREGVKKFGAASGDVVVMEPYTGAVLAMATYPGYDPANYAQASASAYKNLAVSDTYEPGSTFKSLIMASAIDAGAVKPETTCPCGAPTKVGEYTIHNWDNTYRKDETMNDILKNSDNNGMVWVGQKLGKDKELSYIQKFGIGEATNIDLQNEEAPPLREKKAWYPIDYATATFGQGIAVTPIQLVRAVSALANGGRLMEPHVVQRIIASDGKEIVIQPKVIRQVISEDASKTISQMLMYVVDNGEAKRLYKPNGFSMAAKSGTAQIPIAGRYEDLSKVIASYVGFAPVNQPRFVILVRLKQPAGGEHGALTAGPIFYDIARELFTYWAIPPDRPEELQ